MVKWAVPDAMPYTDPENDVHELVPLCSDPTDITRRGVLSLAAIKGDGKSCTNRHSPPAFAPPGGTRRGGRPCPAPGRDGQGARSLD
jgi:hypothetical protein